MSWCQIIQFLFYLIVSSSKFLVNLQLGFYAVMCRYEVGGHQAEVTIDGLINDFKLHQHKNIHRHTS